MSKQLMLPTALLVFVWMLQPVVSAAEDARVLVRAIGTMPSSAVVQYIATKTTPTDLTAKDYPDFAKLTAAEVATRLCGMLEDGYLQQVNDLNKPTIVPSGQPLGDLAYAVRWPACLRVEGPVTYKVRKNDTFTGIRLALTGQEADDAALKAYFLNSGVGYAKKRKIPVNTVLTLPYQTIGTLLRVPPGNISAGFEVNLRALPKVLVNTYPKVAGRIAPYGGGGSIQGSDDDCDSTAADEDYPFRAQAIVGALEWLKALPSPPGMNMVTVAVADNGFLGVSCQPDNCPVMDGAALHPSDRFPPWIYAPQNFYQNGAQWVGPLPPNPTLYPITYGHGVASTEEISEISGHGTHVAGLVMGGPLFQVPLDDQGRLPRDALKQGGDNKLRISIFALAQGTEELSIGAQDTLQSYLLGVARSPEVVNLSLIFDGTEDPNVEKTFANIVSRFAGTLFVAAAGNQGQAVNGGHLVPVGLGGPSRDNVLTVASVDPGGKLSHFSNRGASRVDIAAPGCRISSWLDADSEEVPLSGTSQAAAIASFASGVLAMADPYAPARTLKNRLVISGDLLSDQDSRAGVASMSRLNIAKALYFPADYVRFQPPNQPAQIYLGRITQFTGVSTNDPACAHPDFSRLQALKRLDPDHVVIFAGLMSGEVDACNGALSAKLDAGRDNLIHFQPASRPNGDRWEPVPAGAGLDIPAEQLEELVLGPPH